MSFLWRLGLAGALATALPAVLPAPLPAQSRAELEKVLRRKVLANGMEVIVVENHGVPIATLEINVRNGAFTQPPEYAGLAHMYEHMFFKANTDLHDAQAFNDRAGELGLDELHQLRVGPDRGNVARAGLQRVALEQPLRGLGAQEAARQNQQVFAAGLSAPEHRLGPARRAL